MAILILLFSLVFYLFGIFGYARWMERIFDVQESRKTPAVSVQDGIDRVSANKFVLLGHHFASIAGAAPIIGPVLALSMWNWVWVILWVVLGAVFVGGLHDFGSLMLSLRFGGMSVGTVAEKIISPKFRSVFLFFLLFAVILVIAVFASVAAKTYQKDISVAVSSFGLIFVAVFMGLLWVRFKWSVLPVTVIGLLFLCGLLYFGNYLSQIGITANLSSIYWIVILMGYALIAAVVPVQYLLQPRDYLSSYLLIFGLFVGIVGIVFGGKWSFLPALAADKITSSFWPMLFVIVACGALSGFHSLIASGTTSKQLAKETDGRYVVYLAMLLESMLAVVSVLVVMVGFNSWDEFFQVLSSSGPIGVFACGFEKVSSFILGKWAKIFAVVMLNAFILTTLDTATRIGRYLMEELFGLKNRFLSSIIVVGLSGILAASGKWKLVWPLFGAANQLMAAIVLLILSVFLKSRARVFCGILAGGVFITVLASLLLKTIEFVKMGNWLWSVGVLLLLLLGWTLLEVGKRMLARDRV